MTRPPEDSMRSDQLTSKSEEQQKACGNINGRICVCEVKMKKRREKLNVITEARELRPGGET